MRFTMNHKLTVCVFVTLASIAGCSVAGRFTPLKTTFLEDVDVNAKKENLPFDHSLVQKNAKKSDYQYIMIKPVRTDLLDKTVWINSTSALILSEADYMAKANDVAKYFDEQLVKEMAESKDQRLKLISAPQPNTLILEIALTELEFSHPLARAGSLASPIPGTGAAVSALSDPHAAFAARMTDAQTGQLLATAGDRKFAPTRIIDLNKYTVSSSVREICALWAKSLAEAAQGDGFSKVEEKTWTLMPW